jgi:hypothetical protein
LWSYNIRKWQKKSKLTFQTTKKKFRWAIFAGTSKLAKVFGFTTTTKKRKYSAWTLVAIKRNSFKQFVSKTRRKITSVLTHVTSLQYQIEGNWLKISNSFYTGNSESGGRYLFKKDYFHFNIFVNSRPTAQYTNLR